MSETFDYDVAFSRSLGWVTPEELQRLKKAKVAIGGAGGVGGVHLITLARLGLTHFHLADPDTFELKNFNRQYGADMTTLGKNKCEVMVERVKNINPQITTHVFDNGVTKENIDEFLNGVDIYVDALDIFAIDIREIVFEECRKRNIPCVTVAPIGMGAALINFLPTSMSFETYFGLRGKSQLEKVIRFTLGLSPSLVYLKSLVRREYSNISENKTSSTPMGCQLSSGVLGTEVLKILLGRKPLHQAPMSTHFDAYTYQLKKTYMWWGAMNPLFLLKLAIFKRLVNKIPKKPVQGAS